MAVTNKNNNIDEVSVEGNISDRGFSVKGRSRALTSADNLASDLIECLRLVPRAGLIAGEAHLARYEARMNEIAHRATPLIDRIASENRRVPSEKAIREIVTSCEIEADEDLQQLWATLIARSCDRLLVEPDLVLIETVKKMTVSDLEVIEGLIEAAQSTEVFRDRETFVDGSVRGILMERSNLPNLYQNEAALHDRVDTAVEQTYQDCYRNILFELKYKKVFNNIGYIRLLQLQIIYEVSNNGFSDIIVTPTGRTIFEMSTNAQSLPGNGMEIWTDLREKLTRRLRAELARGWEK